MDTLDHHSFTTTTKEDKNFSSFEDSVRAEEVLFNRQEEEEEQPQQQTQEQLSPPSTTQSNINNENNFTTTTSTTPLATIGNRKSTLNKKKTGASLNQEATAQAQNTSGSSSSSSSNNHHNDDANNMGNISQSETAFDESLVGNQQNPSRMNNSSPSPRQNQPQAQQQEQQQQQQSTLKNQPQKAKKKRREKDKNVRICIQPLRCMSFHIRMDSVFDGLDAWKHRKQSVASIVLKQACDVVAIQEALSSQVDDLKQLLTQSDEGDATTERPEYECVQGASESFDKVRNEWLGCYNPIFYNKKKLELLEKGHFWLSSEPSEPGSKSWDAICPRLCNWAKFHTIFESEKIEFLVFNTQFDQGIAARRNSSFVVREHIENLAVGFSSSSLTHTIVMGDLNCSEKSNCFSVLTRGVDLNADESDESDNEDMDDDDSDKKNRHRRRGGESDEENGEDSDEDDEDDDESFQLLNSTEQVEQKDVCFEEDSEKSVSAATFVGLTDQCTRTGPRTGKPTTVDYILVSSEIKVEKVVVLDEVCENGRRPSSHRPLIADLMI